ncbi:MAG: CRISPR-associated protein Cas4 [Anaerolineae bacterium]|nr:CRISPR-associated protein Cas4 [Anaerolineae bacterium]
MPDLLLLVALAVLVFGVALWWRARRRWRQLDMPAGTPVYQDTRETPGGLLISRGYGLNGKPDFLLRQGGMVIPVEVKTGKTPARPYPGHVMQLAAYCVLVEENYGVRPPHGVIRYPERQFTVTFTAALEESLANILDAMRQQRRMAAVHRSHSNPRVCRACGYRERCDERLGA